MGYRFKHQTDTALKMYDGQSIEIIEAVSLVTYDALDVGPMFVCRFPDGYETELFADEIVRED